MLSISRCVTQAGGGRGALGDGVTVGDTGTTAAIGTGRTGHLRRPAATSREKRSSTDHQLVTIAQDPSRRSFVASD